jgi:periplasmic divalent cation tolerance protein
VEEGLAACVNAIPGIASTYRWEGRVQETREVLLLIKSSSAAYGRLEARIHELHPYELPEVVAVAIVAAYLSWLNAALTTVSE